jgi:hypothetical protein
VELFADEELLLMFACRAGKGFSPLIVSGINVTGTATGPSGSGTVVSENGPDTVVSDGSGSYSYTWEHLSTSSGGTPGISNANAANPVWSRIGVSDGTPSTSSWRLTVEDLATGETLQVTRTVTLTWINTA